MVGDGERGSRRWRAVGLGILERAVGFGERELKEKELWVSVKNECVGEE